MSLLPIIFPRFEIRCSKKQVTNKSELLQALTKSSETPSRDPRSDIIALRTCVSVPPCKSDCDAMAASKALCVENASVPR
jgi:hypothetical protein